jgi:hypothetical protein
MPVLKQFLPMIKAGIDKMEHKDIVYMMQEMKRMADNVLNECGITE